MSVPTIQQFPYLAPVGSFPPATVQWCYVSTTVPAGLGEWVIPPQPGVPLGTLNAVQWQCSDIFFRVENPSTTAQCTLQIARYTGTGVFSTTNFLNDVPIVIPANANECTGRPFTTGTINNPLVNTGDKIQPVISLGLGASVVIIIATFVLYPTV